MYLINWRSNRETDLVTVTSKPRTDRVLLAVLFKIIDHKSQIATLKHSPPVYVCYTFNKTSCK